MTAEIRTAVVGAGIGDEWARALSRQPGVSVVAVCARTSESVERVADVYAVPGRYLSYEAMLEQEEPDLVVVATPNALHVPVATAALEAGAHVVCEKPLGLDAEEAERLVRLADELDRRTLVPFTWRFLPAARYVKELLDDGAVGSPYHVHARYYVRGWGDPSGPMRWQFDAAAAGSGALGNVGSHALHLVQWWLGDVAEVCARTTTAVRERGDRSGEAARVSVDDAAGLLAELEDGTPLVCALSLVAFGPRVSLEIGIFGSDGALLFDDDWGTRAAPIGRVRLARRGDSGWAEQAVPARLVEGADRLDPDAPLGGCFDRMAVEIAAAIREGRPAVPDFHEGLRVQRVLDASLASARERRWVSVAETGRCARAGAEGARV